MSALLRLSASTWFWNSVRMRQPVRGSGLRGLVRSSLSCADPVALGGGGESRVSLVGRFVAFIRVGYPHGVPQTDYIPLLALLRRRLSDEEVAEVARDLAARGELNVDIADVGAAIMRITDALPSATDRERVQRRLEATGWPGDPELSEP
jgi:Protein of unknown function (DUF3349)